MYKKLSDIYCFNLVDKIQDLHYFGEFGGIHPLFLEDKTGFL